MSSRSRSFLFRRKDFTLTLWYTLIMLLILALISGFFAYRLYHNMIKQVDAILLDEAHEIEPWLSRGHEVASLKWFVSSQLDRRRHFKIFLRAVEWTTFREMRHVPDVWRGKEGPFRLDDGLLRNLRPNRPVYRTLGRGGSYRQISVIKQSRDGVPYLLQLSTRLDLVHKALTNLLRNLLLLVPLLVLFCGIGGWVMARRALSPVRRIASTAQRITAENMKERLRTTGTGDEMDYLTETINGMLDRLERAFEEMRRFSADVAHELRTPLTSMRGEAEMLLSKARSVEEYREGLEHFLEQFERLVHLTNSLLLLAKLESRPATRAMERVELGEIIRDLVDFFTPPAQDRGIHMEVDIREEGATFGDPAYLQQALLNLLDNAVKYTPQGGRVHVGLTNRDRTVHLKISNTGDGIPPQDLPWVFERFYRVEKSRDRRTGGCGLGLNITKKIVELHGGRIHIQSTPGKWTAVSVTLPLAPSNETHRT